jgi:hypothetical protein
MGPAILLPIHAPFLRRSLHYARPDSALALFLVATLIACLTPRLSQAQFNVGLRLDFSVGTGPWSVAIGDLNGDGKSDLVTANQSSASISVLLGNGLDGFGAKTDFTVGTSPTWVAIGDLNGDGKPDVVASNFSANTVSVLIGNGAGGLGPKADSPLGNNPRAGALADLNGDGKLDLVVANQTDNTVSVLLGNGAGGFGAKTDFTTGTQPVAVAIGDVNGDGKLDLAVANYFSNTVSVLLGNGAGGFGAKTDFATGSFPRAVALADLNGDGKLDLAVANQSDNTVSVLIGNGSGGFGPKGDIVTLLAPSGIAIADATGDGKPDIVVSDANSNSVSVLPGGGGARTDANVGNGAIAVAVADLNADGRLDVVSANNSSNSVSVLVANGAGGFAARTDFASGSSPYAVAAADLNGDGKVDVATANLSAATLSVLFGNGAGSFGSRSDFVTGGSPQGAAIGDLNSDGKPDLVTANLSGNTVSVLLGNGAGGFGPKSDFTTAAGPNSVALADLNGDGKLDLVAADQNATAVSVLLNTTPFSGTTPSFSPKTDFPTGSSPIGVAIADLNADGKPDVVVANNTSTTVSVLINTTAALAAVATFAAKVDYATATFPIAVAIGDVNGDGKLDLAVANSGASSVSVFLGNGDGTFGAKTDYTAAGNPYSVAIGDLNGDGKVDLAVANAANSSISVLLGNGSGSFAAKTDYTTGSAPRSVAIVDVNGDGRLDLASANSSSNNVSVMLGLEPTHITVDATPNPCVLGSSLALTATVTVPALGSATPTDSVRLFDGSTLLGAGAVNGGTAGLAVVASQLGTRTLTAVYKGNGRLFGSISAPVMVRVVPSANPTLTGIADVPNDQGRAVRLRFRASGFDFAGSPEPITHYDIFRRIAPGLSPAATQNRVHQLADPTHALVDGWDFVATLTAYGDSAYNLVGATLADSNGSGLHPATFFVRAATASASIYYDSQADSGYSVDNLPPAPPAPFTAAYVSGATHLHWGANAESDLWYYAVYRGSSADFTPGPLNRITTRSDTGYVDAGPAGSYYKLSAVDVNGNESSFAVLGPNQTSAVVGGGVGVFSLDLPSPTRADRLAVSFSLPDAAPAKLELIDVTGRRISRFEVGLLGAGRHTLDLATARRVAPGLYLLRLTQGSNVRIARAVVLE